MCERNRLWVSRGSAEGEKRVSAHALARKGDGRGFNLVNCRLITSCLSNDARSVFRSRSSHELWSLIRISRKSTADLQTASSAPNIRESWMLSATTMCCCSCQRGEVVGVRALTLRCGNASA